MAERPVLFRQHGQGRVVAHRADGFLAVLDHRGQDHFQVFQREAGGGLAAGQFLAAVLARLGAGADLLFEIDHVAQPVGIGVAAGQFVDDVVFAVELAAHQVDGDHPARRDRQLAGDAALVDAAHAGFRAHDHQAVVGIGHAQRTQARAVLAGHDPAAVGGAQGGRAVPRLHHRVAVAVESLVRGLHVRAVGFRHQQGLGHRRVAAGPDQHLEGVVQVGRVRTARLDHRLHVVPELAEGVGRHLDLVGLHPVDVALDGVDLTIVGQHPERLGQAPFGEGVGRIALVEDRHRGAEPLVLEVRIEFVDVLGQEHALVDQ